MSTASAARHSWIERVETRLSQRAASWRRVSGGYTPAGRWVVTFEDGQSVFVKIGTTESTANWLRKERLFYEAVRAPFMPKFLAWDDDGEQPLLVLEDLSGANWPPPWDAMRVQRMREALASVAATPPPTGLTRLADSAGEMFGGWCAIAADPRAFLSLGTCSPAWLDRCLPALIASEADGVAALDGESLLHFDVRSDNMCFAGARTLLVDWNLACIGNPLFDVAAWLPSLEYEGGPKPEEVSTESSEFAGLLSGYFASHAGLPSIPDAPLVRRVQREQLFTALPWAVRVLGLPALDEPGRAVGG